MIDGYGVYWVSLDPVQGSEIAKTRIGTRLDGLDPSAETQVRHLITRMYGVLAFE